MLQTQVLDEVSTPPRDSLSRHSTHAVMPSGTPKALGSVPLKPAEGIQGALMAARACWTVTKGSLSD